MSQQLTLKEAIQNGQLTKFIEQEERRGVAPANPFELDEVLAEIIKPPRSADRTSRSPSHDGSAET